MIFHSTANNKIIYISAIKRTHISIYWFILVIIVASAAALPFINMDISVRSQGIIRPVDEKTALRSSISTIIDSIYFNEGDTVQKGDIIIQLRKENIAIQKTMNENYRCFGFKSKTFIWKSCQPKTYVSFNLLASLSNISSSNLRSLTTCSFSSKTMISNLSILSKIGSSISLPASKYYSVFPAKPCL